MGFKIASSTPGQYSDELVKSGTPEELAHECVLPVVCNMSNTSSKHGRCAARHAPTTVALGMIAPLCSYYQPKTERTPKLSYNGTYRGRIHLENNIKWYLAILVHQQFWYPFGFFLGTKKSGRA